MQPQTPVIDVLIARDDDAWRMYSAPHSWRTPFNLHVDKRGDIFPVGRPDAADLEQFMFATDSPYEAHPTVDGGMQIVARGRSAVTLVVWLQGLIDAGRVTCAIEKNGSHHA